MSQYVFGKTVSLPFDSAVRRITEELAKVGFGVLTTDNIDQALARGVVEHAAVIVNRVFFLVSIGVRIEMNHGEFAELAVVRAQQR